MTDLYIFRHGDTKESGSLLVKFLGYRGDSHNLPILPKGLPALEKIGKFLKDVPTDANFCSPYLRCMESAKIVGSIAKKIYQPDERIQELDSSGGKISSFFKRVNNFLDEINKKNYSAVSICTHGAVIAVIKHPEIGKKVFFFQVLDFPNPGNLIIIKDGKVDTINFNKKP